VEPICILYDARFAYSLEGAQRELSLQFPNLVDLDESSVGFYNVQIGVLEGQDFATGRAAAARFRLLAEKCLDQGKCCFGPSASLNTFEKIGMGYFPGLKGPF
jgi:hypothetical protein